MRLGRLNHVGVATPSIEQSIAMYRDLLGATHIGDPFDLPAQGVRVCFVDTPNCQIELIEPLGPDSPIVKFLENNPLGGQHHVCFGLSMISVSTPPMSLGWRKKIIVPCAPIRGSPSTRAPLPSNHALAAWISGTSKHT